MNASPTALPRLLIGLLALAVPVAAQVDPTRDAETMDRLRRDQDEILRKAERLQGLMQRLLQRYETEKKAEQVRLLREGIAHLERSGILRDVAGIRDDLAATAFTEAMRKQKEVVDDLDRLLDILLERKSMESIDRDLQQVTEQARSARELERRQRELQERAQEATRSEASPAEQALLDNLQTLRDDERREAQRNARDAGTRRPFLESALQRVRELLQEQQRLEQGIQDEAEGKRGEARAQAFDLGELTERTRELQAELRDQAKTEALGDASRELAKEAAGTDQTALQQARDRFEAQVRAAPKRGGTSEGKQRDPAWQQVEQELRNVGTGATPAEREELAKVATAAEKLAGEREQEADGSNVQASERLQQAAEKLAERLRGSERKDAQGTSPAKEVDAAREHLAAAARANQADDTKAAQEAVQQALAALDRARSAHQQQNADAQKQASEMAAEANATAQELQNAPSGEQAERSAGEQLRTAERALRDVESAGENDANERSAAQTAQQRRDAAAAARKELEAAERTLDEALRGAGENNQQQMAEAAQRQQQLQQAAAEAARQLQQAAQNGALTPEQAKQAGEQMREAQQRMQNAAEQLQAGKQASAANEQQAAADAVQQAMDAMAKNRPADAEQKQQLQQQAKDQQQLAEDIVRLAEELKKRDNKAAERKAQAAAEAAKKAQRAMEQGDSEETEEQQEEARKNLEEAAKELEEEEDRYQDLRQEELLFRMKDELTQFLEKQRPLTQQTAEAQKGATADGLSRAMRTKVNQIGEEEQELSRRIEFLITALAEEGNLVYRTVLTANVDDLREVARRLGGRRPDVGSFTTLLQQDVERRSEDLLEALERERKRREQERKDQQQQQQQQQGQNRFDPQRKKLVSLIAELEMLKQLGVDTRNATENLRSVVDARGEDVISEAEVSLIERLAHRHNEITKLFQQIKAGIEQTMQQMQGGEGEEGGGGR